MEKQAAQYSTYVNNLLIEIYIGVILDIKGNLADTIEKLCIKNGKQLNFKKISLDSIYKFDLINQDISNLEFASMLKQIIILISSNNTSDSYWLDKVENVLQNLYNIIKYYNKEIDLFEFHRLVMNDELLKIKIKYCKEELLKAKDSEKIIFEMQNSIDFIQNEYFKLDSKILSVIKSEITRITIPLITEYEIYEKFIKKSSKYEKINLYQDNQIIVLSIDIGKHKMLSKILATFLKYNFQSLVLQNIKNPISKFFIIDEYQEFVNLEDARFLSLSREAKCINISSTQSYSSIKNTLKDELATNVIIQSFVNKIWFRNDDNYTISEIIKQFGKINVKKETSTISENSNESKKYIFKKGFKNKKASISKSLGYVISKENEYDENFFTRELKTFEALMFYINNNQEVISKKIYFERWKESTHE